MALFVAHFTVAPRGRANDCILTQLACVQCSLIVQESEHSNAFIMQ